MPHAMRIALSLIFALLLVSVQSRAGQGLMTEAGRYGVVAPAYNLRMTYTGHELYEGIIKGNEFGVSASATFPLLSYGGVDIHTRYNNLDFYVQGFRWEETQKSTEHTALLFLRDFDLGMAGIGFSEGSRKRQMDYPEFGLIGTIEDEVSQQFVHVEYYHDIYTIMARKGRYDVTDGSDEFTVDEYELDYFTLGLRWYLSNTTRISLILGGDDVSDFRRIQYLIVPDRLERKWGFSAGFEYRHDISRFTIGFTYFFNSHKPTLMDRDRRYEGPLFNRDSDIDAFEHHPAIKLL